MREIKFRAYNSRDKKMHYDITGFEFYKNGNISGIFIDGVFFLIEEVYLMQYTGLHDKNGKEIYEGDIVLYEDEEMSTESGYGDTFINSGVVEYIEENCCFNVTERIKVELEDVLYEGNETLEVIGNLYDNPELLEEK